MTLWPLWIGAMLVVGGSAAAITHHLGAARALWLLAVFVFVTTLAAVVADRDTVVPMLGVVAAIVATGALIAVTRASQQHTPAGRQRAV